MTDATEAHRVALDGEFTIFAVQAAKEQLLTALEKHEAVELDLAGVTEMDGAGMQLLLAARCEAQRQGKPLRLSGTNPVVDDVLALCGLSTWARA